MSSATVYCKYLGVPLETVFGITYKSEKTGKERLVGPFLSLGVALTFYREKFSAGNLTATKYAQYLFNIIDQLNLWASSEHNSLLTAQGKPLDRKYLLENFKVMENATECLRAPVVAYLETHGGKLTRAEYEARDKTLHTNLWTGLKGMPVKAYLENRATEQATRKSTMKVKEDNCCTLYHIDFRDMPVTEKVTRIRTSNPAFNEFIRARTTHTRTQILEHGTRFIWHSGQNNNKSATNIAYGRLDKEEKKALMLKGRVYIYCEPGVDIKLSGTLPIQDDDWVPPNLDKGDVPEPMVVHEEPFKTTQPAALSPPPGSLVATASDPVQTKAPPAKRPRTTNATSS